MTTIQEMHNGGGSAQARVNIEVDLELQRRLEIAAAQCDVTVREYVLAAMEHALQAEDRDDWGRLSEPSFARDWDSAADAAYDLI